jgi:hypothetical protein
MERQIKKLDELLDGGVTERFNVEMERVMYNVYDPNTDPKATRQIQIIINIKPNERRDAAEFKVDVKSKTAPMAPISQTVFLRQDDYGNVICTERTREVPGQIDMEGNEQPMPKVVTFGKAE